MSATSTRTTTQTNTLTSVNYVTRKVQTDFLEILDTYGYFNETYARNLIHDLRAFLDEEVIDRIKFTWVRPGTNYVLAELDYAVMTGRSGLADDRAGGIRYRADLKDASFQVRVFYNARWRGMQDADREAIRQALVLSWGAAGQLDYSDGYHVADRTYSREGLGLARSNFVR